jgi:hypothetical protein
MRRSRLTIALLLMMVLAATVATWGQQPPGNEFCASNLACSVTGPWTFTTPLYLPFLGSTQCLGVNSSGQIVTVACGGGSSAFNSITSGTNTSAAMVVGSGASLTVAGTGTIVSTLHQFAATASTGGTTQNLLVVYDGTTGNVTTPVIASAGVVGIASATATSGNPLFVIDGGLYTCIADNTVTVGDLLGVGTTTAGRCKDLGTAQGNGVPSNVQIVGKAVSGGSAGSSVMIQTVGAGHYGTLVVAASTNTSICSNNSCTQTAAGVTNATLTTSLTNNGGAGTLTWPVAGATLTIPIGGGTLASGAFASAYSLPTRYTITPCSAGLWNGGSAIKAATYTLTGYCLNVYAVAETVAHASVFNDAGSSTCAVNIIPSGGGSGNTSLSTSTAGATAWLNNSDANISGTYNSIASGSWLTFTIVADGTSTRINCVLTLTR